MDELQHECGIAAIYHFDRAAKSNLVPASNPGKTSWLMPRMLIDLQNRGQLAAGFTTFNAHREKLLDTYKQVGTVTEAFRLNHPKKFESIMTDYEGSAAIGHTRYATCGANDKNYAQPFERYHGRKWKWFAIAFNGQLTNYQELHDELLLRDDYHLQRNLDTEVIMHFLSYELRNDDRPDLVKVFSNLSQRFDGAYNIAYMNAMGEMVLARDPMGFRPLCYAQNGPLFAAASESVALTNLGFNNVKSLEPGEMILIQDNELKIVRFAPRRKTSHCFFEWIYFANVASTLDDRSVYLSRSELGKQLATQEHRLGRVPLDDDTLVVPVPDTGKAAADAMAYELGLPSAEGLMRNRYIGRTFIEGVNRAERVRMKFTPLREVMENKRILLIEDSIVRSTTLKTLLTYIREQGRAREIHVRVACPPIVAPCFYGIDMSTITELYAPRFMKGKIITLEEQEAMAKDLGADSLFYLPLESLAKCINLPEDKLCRACVTGDYPTEWGEKLYQLALRKKTDPQASNGRTYEHVPATVCG